MAVRQAPESDRVIVKFAVDDWIKPASGEEQVSINVVDPRPSMTSHGERVTTS